MSNVFIHVRMTPMKYFLTWMMRNIKYWDWKLNLWKKNVCFSSFFKQLSLWTFFKLQCLDKLSYVDMHIMCNMRQKNTRYIKILDIKQARCLLPCGHFNTKSQWFVFPFLFPFFPFFWASGRISVFLRRQPGFWASF